jgi:glycosyltransferase involved in cell wall biosynthesis
VLAQGVHSGPEALDDVTEQQDLMAAPMLPPTPQASVEGSGVPGRSSGPELTRRRPAVSIVVPTYNEERRLQRSFPELRRLATEQKWGDEVELIIVDDGSSDRTVETARVRLAQFPRGRLLRLPWHAGKGAAVRLGVAAAEGDAIAFMDADLATELSALPRGLAELQEADVVIGSRVAPGAVVTGRSHLRKALHRVFGSQARRLTGVSASDPQCGFKTFRSEAAKLLFPISRVDGFGFDVEILLLAQKLGYRVVEIPVRWHAVAGSHVHVLRDPLTMLSDLVRVRLRYRRKAPLATAPPPVAGPQSADGYTEAEGGFGYQGRGALTAATGQAAVGPPCRRIVFLSWRDLAHPQAGGSEVLIDQLARGCADRGHDVGLMCGSPTAARAYGVTPLGGPYEQYLRAPLVYARRFRGADVLVDTENGIPFFSPLWRRGPVVCLVHHVHRDQWSLRFPPPIAALGRALEEGAMPLAYRRSLFLCVSQSTASDLAALGVPPSQVRVLPMGVDIISAPPTGRSSTPLFLALGRLVPHKRLDLLLRIWELVRPHIGGRLVIAGDGPERERLQRLAGQGVEIRGKVSQYEKRRLLDRAWLLVHSALHEGWGIVIMEAAAAGMPALAFDVPGVRDAVRNQETGVLAPSEGAFAREWIALAEDAQRRERMGAAALRHAERTPWSVTVDAFLGILDEAVRRNAKDTSNTA